MRAIHIAIPVLKGKANFTVDKGRPWSIIEHMILEALHRKEWTAVALAEHANIPRRIIVEAIIRLMRAGWVDLMHSSESVVFKANILGSIALAKSELPNILERKARPTNFIVDLVDGNIFRNRDWTVVHENDVRDRSRKDVFVILQPNSFQASVDVSNMLDILLDADETFVNAEASGVVRRYVIASVRDGVVHGLPPKRELPELKHKLLLVARSHCESIPGDIISHEVAGPRYEQVETSQMALDVHFNLSDLIIDGEAHLASIEQAISGAQTKLIIHSTFISESGFLRFLPKIASAAKRGVIIHIFWGQNDDKEEVASTRAAIDCLKKNKDVISLDSSIVFHPHSTGSHSKFIVSDSGVGGDFIAVIGSCNWFASNYSSYEVSVLLRDPKIVKDVVGFVSRLCCIHDGIWSQLASELVEVSRKVSARSKTYLLASNAKAILVMGAQHGAYVIRSRDEAKKRIFVTSHRLGGALYSSTLPSFKEAVNSNGVTADIYYGRNTSPVSKSDLRQAVESAYREGVSLTMVEHPRLHAKVLGWDDDFVLVSSLNWLSGDPPDSDNLKEVGVFIQAKGVASMIVNDLSAKIAEA